MTSSSQTRPPALIVGLDSVTGLQTARILARYGIPVVGVAADPTYPTCRTNVCERIVFGPTSGEPLIEMLGRLAGDFSDPPVLFPCTDLAVLTLSRHREALFSFFKAVLPRPGVIERLLNKAQFAEYATQAGLPIPVTHVLRKAADAQIAAREMRFPAVIKPDVKTAHWTRHTTAKLFKASNAREFLDLYERCASWTEALVAQEWVDGTDQHHVTCNAYFDEQTRPVITFVSQKLRQWPLEGGIGCFSQEYRDDDVLRETLRVFQGVAYHGLAYLEMKLDRRTGRHAIIEANVGRPTGRSACADWSGAPLLYTQYCDALGWSLPESAGQRYQGAKWIYLRRDCQSAFAQWQRGTLRPLAWLRSLRGCQRDAVFAWDDPQPFVADLFRAVGKAASRRTERRSTTVPSGLPLPSEEDTRA